jgi:hypothetical protein
LKEAHVVVFTTHGSQHFTHNDNKGVEKLHHGFMYVHCHESKIRSGYPWDGWGVCSHIEGYLQLRDGVIQVVFKVLWKKLGKIIKRLGKLVEL